MLDDLVVRAARKSRWVECMRDLLIAEHGLTPALAAAMAAKLGAMDADLREAFEIWTASGQVSRIAVEGLSIEALMTSYRMTTVVAFLTLNHLRHDPKRAFAALMKRSEPATFGPSRARMKLGSPSLVQAVGVPMSASTLPAVRHLNIVSRGIDDGTPS